MSGANISELVQLLVVLLHESLHVGLLSLHAKEYHCAMQPADSKEKNMELIGLFEDSAEKFPPGKGQVGIGRNR